MDPDSIVSRSLTPLSWLYAAGALLRRRWLEGRARALDRPVVSVGNVTCGGTGKTPAVEMVVRDLIRLGRRPAILSRGYGGAVRGGAGPAGGNDELLVLAANLPGVPHYQGRDRHPLGVEAIARGADVLVLDDGFQHAGLSRDMDLVLIDALSPFGGGRVLPAGLLREPLSVLARATHLAITRSNRVAPLYLSTLSAYLRVRFPGVPQLLIETHPVEWRALGGGTEPPEALRGRRALAFSGIGNPTSFLRELEALGIEVAELIPFPDHHGYTRRDLERIASRAAETRADEVLLTQKDAVKISAAGRAAGWKALRIESRVSRGAGEYAAALAGLGGGAEPGGGPP
jgi:tetraacyldisaccharide 4'-kinase